ncbi:MAG: acetolactate synthase small subunit [Coriobacteriales bacterium]|jgi:acetolactate synthase-1/3 small subunit
MSRTISVLVDNQPGVLARVTGLIARRGFNIESLAVSHTEDATRSRVTVVVDADEVVVEQVTKQLHKLINVYKVNDLTEVDHIDRELVLFKVNAEPGKRAEITQLASIFRARIVDVAHNSLTIEATGTDDKLAAMEDLLRGYGIKEIIRSGKIAISRGSASS